MVRPLLAVALPGLLACSAQLDPGATGEHPDDAGTAADRDAAPDARGDAQVPPEPEPDAAAEEEPVTALVGLTRTTPQLGQLSVTANAGFVEVDAQTIEVLTGDLLRIRGQVEWTNDAPDPVGGVSDLLVDGQAVAPQTYQNNVSGGTHHTVLYQSAQVIAARDGALPISLRFAAAQSSGSPSVLVEAAHYTQLVVERYRTFPSLGAARDAGARLLGDVSEDRATDVTTYGEDAFVQRPVYEIALPLHAGDLVRLSGQTTSGWTLGDDGLPHDMHGTAIHVAGADAQQLSAWSTENTPWDVQYTPLWTDAVHAAAVDGDASFRVTMHGVNGHGGVVVGSLGHLAGMVFRDAAAAGDERLRGLVLSETTVRADDVVHTSNTGSLVVLSRGLEVTAGTVARIEATLQLSRVAGYSLNPVCTADLALTDSLGGQVAGARATKYLTTTLDNVALRTEILGELAMAGAYAIALSVHCSRQDEDTAVRVVGPGARILVDAFF